MATLDRWAAVFKFDCLDKRTQVHLKNVYSCMSIAMLAASVGAYLHLARIIQFGLLTFFGTIGLMIWLLATPHNAQNVQKRIAILSGIGLLTGMSLGPLLERVIQIDPSIIPTAFLATCLIFGSFSLAALYAKERQFLYLGGFLSSCLSLMVLGSLMNVFLGSRVLYEAHIYLGLLVMIGFVMYDTQLIIAKCRHGDDDFVWHSVDLFLDFINIFQRLLIILSNKEEKKKNKK